MPATSSRNLLTDWWKLRRVRWPLLGLLTLGLAAGVALSRSRASLVIVYNATGSAIPELTISACSQSRAFHEVGDRESVHLKLAPRGGESDITVATNGVALWRGEYIEPAGGYRVTVRLRGDGQVETSSTISWWQTWLR